MILVGRRVRVVLVQTGFRVEGQLRTIDGELYRSGFPVRMDARPCPFLRSLDQRSFHWVVVNVIETGVVFLRRSQSMIEKSALPELTRLLAPQVRLKCRPNFNDFHDSGNGEWMVRKDYGMPVVRQKDPRRQQKMVRGTG